MKPSRYLKARVTMESPGGTCPERSSAVTTSAVIPGSRWVDQPPLASCRGRRNLMARSIMDPIEGTADAVCPQTKPDREPREPTTPRPARPRLRNRRRVATAGSMRDPFPREFTNPGRSGFIHYSEKAVSEFEGKTADRRSDQETFLPMDAFDVDGARLADGSLESRASGWQSGGGTIVGQTKMCRSING